MPTPVSLARQCLTPDAAHALDEAVSVARRRGHAQTSSLHAVSALLSLPTSILRDACARARNSAYSPRLQFRALELCLSVSLDRAPSTQLNDDPPVSNSLMAAIKRSQANQRRQPENYHLYHQLPQQSSISCVKVELQHLILSILDDPVVSRVFGEAGFRSSEIKLAILRPYPQLFRYSRSRGPPVFLCNLADYSDPGIRSSGFAFPSYTGLSRDGDENCRRIGEVIGRNKGNNPLLVGVCAYDALRNFSEAVENRKDGVLPVGLSGLNVICLEKDISKFINEDCDKGSLDVRFREVSQLAEQCLGSGLVVNFGDLKAFVGDSIRGSEVSCVVAQLTRLLELRVGKVWLIGSVASYESYLKFVSRFPSIEKDWDLQLLPITSLKSSMAASYPRSSLMESFVPFGGFFSATSDVKFPFSGSFQSMSNFNEGNESSRKDTSATSKGDITTSVAERYQSCLPSWLEMVALSNDKVLDVKTKDDRVVLNTKVPGLQDKVDNQGQHLHDTQPVSEANLFPNVAVFQSTKDEKGNKDNLSYKTAYVPSDVTKFFNVNSSVPIDVEKISKSPKNSPFSVVSKAKNGSFLSKLLEKPLKAVDHDLGGVGSSTCSLSSLSACDDLQSSPASVTSVTTDLGLGLSSKDFKMLKQSHHQSYTELQSGGFCVNAELVNGGIFNHAVKPSPSSSPHYYRQVDPRDMKMLFRVLFERVCWQQEAVSLISQTVAHWRTKSEKRQGAGERGDLWMNFTGPDQFGKKKIAVALAEILYGNQENFICVNLCSQDGLNNAEPDFGRQEISCYDVKFRGKTAVDYIVEQLCKRPFAVVFLENIDKSDLLAQKSFLHAVLTGKLSDSYGREVGTNNAIFVTTSSVSKDQNVLIPRREPSNYSEERILSAKGWPLKITIECLPGDNTASQNLMASDTTREGTFHPVFLNKRKLHQNPEIVKRVHKTSIGGLDLNLPAKDSEVQQTSDGNSENESVSEISQVWLQDLFDQLDETVVFRAVDFDALADKVSRDIKNNFHEFFHSESLLEIELGVMEQLLAAIYLSDSYKVMDDWVQKVLKRGFAEIHKQYCFAASNSVVKLVTCEGVCLEEQSLSVLLPPRIIIG